MTKIKSTISANRWQAMLSLQLRMCTICKMQFLTN